MQINNIISYMTVLTFQCMINLSGSNLATSKSYSTLSVQQTVIQPLFCSTFRKKYYTVFVWNINM